MEFKDRLKKLLDEKGITAEKLSKDLNTSGLSGNTIRNYLKGGKPKSTEIYEILANYFDVSVDYLIGKTNERSTNTEIKVLNEKYGLSEKSLNILKLRNNVKKSFEPVYKYTEIDTINLLLEDFADNKYSSIINQIDLFINAQINPDYSVTIQKDGSLQIWNRNESSRASGIGVVDGEAMLQSLLGYIELQLHNLRTKNLKNRGE